MLVLALYTQVLAGQRPPIPKHCPADLSDLMQACWHKDACERPTFTHILSQVGDRVTHCVLYCPLLNFISKNKITVFIKFVIVVRINMYIIVLSIGKRMRSLFHSWNLLGINSELHANCYIEQFMNIWAGP